jgi:hypothetical protein
VTRTNRSTELRPDEPCRLSFFLSFSLSSARVRCERALECFIQNIKKMSPC